MVTRGSLSPGGSYGRVQAIIAWAQTNWSDFDGWCCSKNIDPLELSAYRFYNLALWYLRDDKTEEGLALIEEQLSIFDQVQNPLSGLLSTSIKIVYAGGSSISKSGTPQPEEKPRYVPPWWRGDEINAKIAMSVMGDVSTMT